MSSEPMTGGCQCGAVRYEVAAVPVAIYVCHCTECRRQSASAFGISVYVPRMALRVTAGTPETWTRPGRATGQIEGSFCRICGVRLWHQSRDTPETLSIKGGTIDQPIDIGRAIHVWTRSRLPGVVIPTGAEQHLQEPIG